MTPHFMPFFVLFVVYQFKHFFADYPLQGRYMLGKFNPGFKWILPLLAHVAVHGIFTFVIVSFFLIGDMAQQLNDLEDVRWYWWHFVALKAGGCALFDMACHFVMDMVKANQHLLGRYKALSANEMRGILSYVPTLGEKVVKEKFGNQLKSNTIFWWCLGLDQMVHHLTHYAIILWLALYGWKI